MVRGPKKSARAAPIPFAAAPAPLVFEPAPSSFDPGPPPVDLVSGEQEPALEPAAFDPPPAPMAVEPAIFEEPAHLSEPTLLCEPAALIEPTPLMEPAPIVLASTATVEAMEDKVEAVAPTPAALHDMQEKARALYEKGIVETRAHYAKTKTAADEATSALEASFGAAKTGAAQFNLHLLAAIRTHAEANFDFVKSIVAVTSLSDFVTLNAEFARKQFEAWTAQSKDIGALAQQVATDTVGPIKAHMAKTLNIAV